MSLTLGPDVLDRSAAAGPLTTQLADHLRQAIASLDLAPGATFPGENKIADAVGISRPMVRDALDVLDGEGLIVRRKGASTRVAIPPSVRLVNLTRYMQTAQQIDRGEEPTTAFVVDHGARDEDYTITPVEITQEKATGQDAEYLKVRKGTAILRRRFIQRLGGEALQIHRQAMRYSLAKGTELEQQVRKAGGILAELRSVGIVPTHFAETWSARMPNRIERELLDMHVTGPVFDMLRVFVIADNPKADDLSETTFTSVQVSRIISPCARNSLHCEGRLSPHAVG